MTDGPVFRILTHQGHTAGRREIFGRNLHIRSEKRGKRVRKKLFVHDRPCRTVQCQNRMCEAEDVSADHRGIVAGGIRLVRRMLVRTEMTAGAVEIGIIDFGNRTAGSRFHPAGRQVHQERGLEIFRKFRFHADVVGIAG